jgi:UTP--glucose-1-phosphate uridylyltransferase
VSAVNVIGPAELKGFGTIAGKRRAENQRLIDVSLIVEKPSVDVAREKLRVDGLADDEFLGWFGMHLLAPSIYDVLAEMIRNNTRDNGEFQLTRAQEIQRQREGYLALEMTHAERFDFGIPDDFVASLQSFRKANV